jgi:hypothetical protein
VIRRFLIVVLIFLIAVLVAADRLGAIVAAHVLAGKVQTDEHMTSRPDTSIGGFPFVTQALSGKYKDIKVSSTDLPVDGVNVTSLTVHLHGVHVKLGDVIHGTVSLVPVDRVDGAAVIAFADVNTYLSTHHPAGQDLSFRAGAGKAATIIDKVRVGGKTVSLRGAATVSLNGNVVDVEVKRLSRAAGGGAAVTAQILQHVLSQLRISLPLKRLPFRINLETVAFSATGISVTGEAHDVVLGSTSTS